MRRATGRSVKPACSSLPFARNGSETGRRVVVDARSPGIVEIESGTLEVLGVQEDVGVMAAEVDVLESLEDFGDRAARESAARQLQVECRIDAPVLLDAVVVQVPQKADVRGEDQHVFALGMVAAHEELLYLAHVDARDISQLRMEALGAVDEVDVVEPVAVLVEKVEVVGRTAAVRAIEIARLAGHHLAGECPGVVELEPRVESRDAIVTAGKLAIGDQHAHVRFAEVALHADHSDGGAPAGIRIVRIESRARRPVVDGQHSQVPVAQFSGDASAEFGVDDAARKEEILRRRKIAVVLQKEGTLLREDHLEALVHRDLRIVGFHLAEIGIERDVQRERVVNHRLGVQPRAEVRLAAEGRHARVGLIQKVRPAESGIRNQLQIAPRRDVLQAGHLGQLRHEARYLLGDIRPEGILVVGGDAAVQPEAPGLHGLRGKAQAAEGNRHHGDVSLRA